MTTSQPTKFHNVSCLIFDKDIPDTERMRSFVQELIGNGFRIISVKDFTWRISIKNQYLQRKFYSQAKHQCFRTKRNSFRSYMHNFLSKQFTFFFTVNVLTIHIFYILCT